MQYQLTKFSGNNRSSMENMLAKFRCPKMVAMETVTDSLFSSMPDISAGGETIALTFCEFVLQDQRYSSCLEHIFL